ncbi:hypothetical protein XENTR_v10020383 [Xenopus tropicalis]|nr:hypothetical protein XENTR_v10020383 [Xenopus tropicalis]
MRRREMNLTLLINLPFVCRVMNKGIFLAFHWRQGTEREWLSPFEHLLP